MLFNNKIEPKFSIKNCINTLLNQSNDKGKIIKTDSDIYFEFHSIEKKEIFIDFWIKERNVLCPVCNIRTKNKRECKCNACGLSYEISD